MTFHTKPNVVVETGSGATTLVIADALRQNGIGKLFSFEHLKKYADQTYQTLVDESLTPWVELRVGELQLWEWEHLNPKEAEKDSKWYPLNLKGIENIDLLLVDGPPGNTCQFAR
ncbi:class I SAM-dependent methyltransferase [Vreelandella zhanjiangensis]|uniref:class I SAM-dependent methyltransferase n=1 Tax=Vreelandella zhanjiangensis TaxID=1121960 RepID=UPI00402AFAB0